jgi:hypothetical protein
MGQARVERDSFGGQVAGDHEPSAGQSNRALVSGLDFAASFSVSGNLAAEIWDRGNLQ